MTTGGDYGHDNYSSTRSMTTGGDHQTMATSMPVSVVMPSVVPTKLMTPPTGAPTRSKLPSSLRHTFDPLKLKAAHIAGGPYGSDHVVVNEEA